MKFISTRSSSLTATFSEALAQGLAQDGGLFIPERFPKFKPADIANADVPASVAEKLLAPFAEGDPLASKLSEITRDALDFPIPLTKLEPGTEVLELYHGPTAAFKDVGARFLAAAMARIPLAGKGPALRTVLVATSGDTGGAVAAAFHRRAGFEVLVLYPKGLVSPRQEHQLTCWGGNVHAFKVRGNFDDCQRLVKEAFADAWWKSHKRLTSANSINVGRLLPQCVYYAAASLQYERRHGKAPGFVIPSGNVGNALACLWAKRMGFPIRRVVLAANANKPVPEYFSTGKWKPLPTVATLANAMDVGNPSNMERILSLYPTIEALRADAEAHSVGDDEIRAQIKSTFKKHARAVDPHTATALHVRAQLKDSDWIVVSTAHPAKFHETVERETGKPVDVPPQLAALFSRPAHATEIDATGEAFRKAVESA